MSNKTNANNNLASDEINLDDFYLAVNNDAGHTTEIHDFTVEKKPKPDDLFFTDEQNHRSKYMNVSGNTNSDNKLLDDFENFSTKNMYSTTKEMEISDADEKLNDDDIINEILNTEVIENNGKLKFNDKSNEVKNVASSSDVSFNTNKNDVLNTDKNLTKLNELKEKLQNASDSFSQITDSIEILSNDINDANQGYVDYFPTETLKTEAEQENKSSDYHIDELKKDGETSEKVTLSSIPTPTQQLDVDQYDLFDENVDDEEAEDSKLISNEYSLPDDFIEKITSKQKDFSDEKDSMEINNKIDLSELDNDEEKGNMSDDVLSSSLKNNKNDKNDYSFAAHTHGTKETHDNESTSKTQANVSNSSINNEKPPFDYDKVMEELKRQAFEQVQSVVRSEMDQLREAKLKFEAEVDEFNRNRSIEADIERLNSRFSSAISHYVPNESRSYEEPFEEEPKQPVSEQELKDVEQQRQNIVNSTKEIMESYENVPTTPPVQQATKETTNVVDSAATTPTISHNGKHHYNTEQFKDMANKVDQMKKEISNLKSLVYKQKLNKATEQLKTQLLTDSLEEEKKLDQMIEQTITDEIEQQVNTSLLSDDNNSFDSLDDMRNSLRKRKVGNEVEEQNKLFEMEKLRNEIKSEILNELRMDKLNEKTAGTDEWNLDDTSEEEVPNAEVNMNDEMITMEHTTTTSPKKPHLRAADLIFKEKNSQLKGRDLIEKYVKEITKKKFSKQK